MAKHAADEKTTGNATTGGPARAGSGRHAGAAGHAGRGRRAAILRAGACTLLAAGAALALAVGVAPTWEADVPQAGAPSPATGEAAPEARDVSREAGHRATAPAADQDPAQTTDPEPARAARALDPARLLAMPDRQRVETFTLDDTADAPELDETRRAALEQAVAAIEGSAPCGFAFVDMQTGAGICYRAGLPLYTASASKALTTFYVLQGPAREAGLDDWTRSEMEAALRYSDNDAYDDFGFAYLDQDLIDWLAGYGVEYDVAEYGLYAFASARSMTAVWDDIAAYLKSDAGDAPWLAEALSETNASFIRDGLEGTGTTVWNKGGWIADGELNSTSDAGIIECEGRTFLMAIVSGQPDTPDARERVAALARMLFDQRSLLA